MSARTTHRSKQLTSEQLALIARTHQLLDEIARDSRNREKIQRAAAPRKEVA